MILVKDRNIFFKQRISIGLETMAVRERDWLNSAGSKWESIAKKEGQGGERSRGKEEEKPQHPGWSVVGWDSS